MRIVVVGGAGFVGSAVSRKLVQDTGASVLVLDSLTATASLASLAPVASSPRYAFRKADIREPGRIAALIQAFAPDAVIHAAAHAEAGAKETSGATDTNFAGSWRLMEAVRGYWANLPEPRREAFRLVGVSRTHFGADDETASTLAASDDVLLSWHNAYGLPSVLLRAPAAFGPCQFPSAFVPATLIASLEGTPRDGAPDGERDWIHVDDLATALIAAATKGTAGTVYTATGKGRASPVAVAARIARLASRYSAAPLQATTSIKSIALERDVAAVAHPPLDATSLEAETGWLAAETLDSGLAQTVRWYLANEAWWRPLVDARTVGDSFGLLRIA